MNNYILSVPLILSIFFSTHAQGAMVPVQLNRIVVSPSDGQSITTNGDFGVLDVNFNDAYQLSSVDSEVINVSLGSSSGGISRFFYKFIITQDNNYIFDYSYQLSVFSPSDASQYGTVEVRLFIDGYGGGTYSHNSSDVPLTNVFNEISLYAGNEVSIWFDASSDYGINIDITASFHETAYVPLPGALLFFVSGIPFLLRIRGRK